MRRFEGQGTSKIHIAIVLSLAGAFLLDALSPLGIAVWVLYLAPVVLSLHVWRPAIPLVVAGAATLLVTVGLLISPSHTEIGTALPRVNRAILVVAIWTVGFVARQLVLAKLTLREQDWVRSGQRDLGVRTQGEQRPRELGENVLRFLCEYLDVPVGAFYMVEPDGRSRRTAAYALGPGHGGGSREVVSPGEGLLGQAVKDGRVMRFDHVPEGYLQVSSALGQARPRHVVVVPTKIDGAVNGAVELGFLREVDRTDMDLLGAVAEHIAVAVRSSLHRTRLEELLAERQRQTEELQAQQEELRVTNEELESQSQILREAQARLEAQQAELEQTNAELESQASAMERQRDELLRAQKDLVQRSDELARASEYKSEFLANMSHELRTPLNSALILARLLADNKEGNLTPEQVKYASTIHTAGSDLLELINDVLNLARIEAGRAEVQPEPVTIARIVEPLQRMFQPVAMQRCVGFHVALEPGLPDAMVTDPLRLQQILRNLLSNAFKFTEAGSVVLRVSRVADARLCFAVKDTGIGIPPEQQQIIFEAFRQADGTTQRSYGGTGLGLTISRELSQRLGGEITVESAPGEGSTFGLLLPLQLSAPAFSAPAGSEPRTEPRAAAAPPPPPPPPPISAPAGAPEPEPARAAAIDDDRGRVAPGDKSVLIIEDDVKFAAILRDLGREHGFHSLVATSAVEGMRLAEQLLPGAIILDVRLPDESGLTVLEHLKGHPSTRHIPIHVVSAADLSQQALEMGAVGYAIKPVRREQLIQALRKLEQKVEQKLRRVLVVEDVAMQRESLVALLSADGVEIVPVATAGEALEHLNSSTFDCMVLDLNLHGTSGFELLDRMAAGESFSFPPVIVYTGGALSREEERRLRRYTSSIIIKGARSPERLLDEVTLFLHQVEAQLPREKQRMLREVRSREAALEGRVILVAEDDVRNVFALSSVLEPRGAKLRIARNGREALELVDQAARDPAAGVDLVLMDIMMPEMDGLTAMREIRKRSEHKKLPIIALTAKTMPDDREKCLLAGANDYISKPLDIDKLVSLIKVWMPK